MFFLLRAKDSRRRRKKKARQGDAQQVWWSMLAFPPPATVTLLQGGCRLGPRRWNRLPRWRAPGTQHPPATPPPAKGLQGRQENTLGSSIIRGRRQRPYIKKKTWVVYRIRKSKIREVCYLHMKPSFSTRTSSARPVIYPSWFFVLQQLRVTWYTSCGNIKKGRMWHCLIDLTHVLLILSFYRKTQLLRQKRV